VVAVRSARRKPRGLGVRARRVKRAAPRLKIEVYRVIVEAARLKKSEIKRIKPLAQELMTVVEQRRQDLGDPSDRA
jgi:hypothetical protein